MHPFAHAVAHQDSVCLSFSVIVQRFLNKINTVFAFLHTKSCFYAHAFAHISTTSTLKQALFTPGKPF